MTTSIIITTTKTKIETRRNLELQKVKACPPKHSVWMELGLNLEDDDFTDTRRSVQKQAADDAYVPKQAHFEASV